MRLILAIALVSLPALAQQQDEFTHEPQGWLAFFGQKKLPNSVFVFWLDAQARLNETATQTQVLLRPGVGVRFRPDMTVWVGYAWTPTIRAGNIAIDEHRLWEQWIWDLTFDNGMKAQLRSRLEQRLQRGEIGVRFRQFARVQSPRYGRGMLVAWDEVFFAFNDTKWGQEAGFDQNRLFAGLGFFIDDSVRLETGYMNQLVHRREAVDPVRHVAMVNVFANW
ncbi:MAG: DUF2490 domain-containing protein [Archangium sp.]